MAAPPSNTGWHPFHSRERVNFPEFSPIFSRHVTPENSRGFHWSIDHIARLKPAEIDTDPFTLVKTNGESPDNDEEKQQAVDRFFSQRTILPSPWPTGCNKTSVRQNPAGLMSTPGLLLPTSITPGHTKKVTFSPHPPSMAYINNDSMESEHTHVNAGTQTVLTIPLTYDLGDVLGPACTYSSNSSIDGVTIGSVRDLANTSLRRKLFAQPSRITEEEEEGREDMAVERTDCGSPQIPTDCITPLKCLSGDRRHLSSTPVHPDQSRHPHSHQRHISHTTPSLSSHSPSLTRGAVSTTGPTVSSFVLTPGGNSPQCSPIEGVSEGGVVSVERSKRNTETCKQLFSHTSNVQLLTRPHITSPSPTHLPTTCPSFSPILYHQQRHCDDGSDCVTVSMTPVTQHSSTNKATSTPYRHGMQGLRSSHHASLCGVPDRDRGTVGLLLERHGEGDKERSESEGEGGQRQDGIGVRGDDENGRVFETSDDQPQPISLADLQTFEDDLTSVTGVTTCTSYFTHLATMTEEDSQTGGPCTRQPLHSTVAIPNSTHNPLMTATTDASYQGASRFKLPSIREISRINVPSTAPSLNSDSGVAVGSSDYSQLPGGSLINNRGVGGREINSGTPRHQEDKENAICREQNFKFAKSDVDSGLVPSPDPAHNDHAHKEHQQEMGGVSRPAFTNINKPSTTQTNLPPSSTPSRYSSIQLYRNKLGVPLAITQKSIFTNHRPINYYSGHTILPSQLKCTPSPVGVVTSSDKVTRTPNRPGSSSYTNWFCRSLTGQCSGGSGRSTMATSPSLFPEDVIRRKATLKAQLQFCSPIRSRSPVTTNRKPFMDTLNFPSPIHPTNHPLSPLPSSHPHSSPSHLLHLSPMTTHRDTWQHYY